MEQKINSSYINEIIFGFLGEIRKLEIIKYNKSFQKNLNININNYKKESKRYIIFESKTRGKEYNKLDHLIYEGEYLNGKRNGKGKEFGNFHEILFEGEYLNGKDLEKEKNIIDILMIGLYNLKANIQMVRKMAKGRNL